MYFVHHCRLSFVFTIMNMPTAFLIFKSGALEIFITIITWQNSWPRPCSRAPQVDQSACHCPTCCGWSSSRLGHSRDWQTAWPLVDSSILPAGWMESGQNNGYVLDVHQHASIWGQWKLRLKFCVSTFDNGAKIPDLLCYWGTESWTTVDEKAFVLCSMKRKRAVCHLCPLC